MDADDANGVDGEVARRAVSIALFGWLNPGIFQPAWFARNAELAERIPSDVEAQMVPGALVALSGGELRLEVTLDRFLLLTTGEPLAARELVKAVFTLLSHTPIEALSLNWEWHLTFSSNDGRDSFFNTLLAGQSWAPLFKSPHDRSFSVVGDRQDQFQGMVVLEIEDSHDVPDGVYIGVVDHIHVEESLGATTALNALDQLWDDSANNAVRMARAITKDWRFGGAF